MTVTAINHTQQRLDISVNQWGNDGSTGDYSVQPEGTESWDRSDSRGFVMHVNDGSEDYAYFVSANSVVTFAGRAGSIIAQDHGIPLKPMIETDTSLSANWMTLYAPQLQDKTFSLITLPGSHDAGMSKVLGQAANVSAQGPYTQTQKYDIYSQIVAGGARVLDLRPVYYKAIAGSSAPTGYSMAHYTIKEFNTWWGLIGESLDDVCTDIKDALATLGSKEVLVLTLSHGSHLTDGGAASSLGADDQKKIIEKLLACCGDHLYKLDNSLAFNLMELTPKQFLESRSAATVLVVAADGSFDQSGKTQADGLFKSTAFDLSSSWSGSNRKNAQEFYSETKKFLADYEKSIPVELSWHISWNVGQSGNLKEYAKEINPHLGSKLSEWKADGTLNSSNRPAAIGWDFVKPYTQEMTDGPLKACLVYNALISQ